MPVYNMADFKAEMRRRKLPESRTYKPTPRGRNGGHPESLKTFCRKVVEAAEMRLMRFEGRHHAELTACPWCVYFGSRPDCRCHGRGQLRVGQVRDHARALIVEFGGVL